MAESQTGPEFEVNIQLQYLLQFYHRTSRSCLNYLWEPCEWIDADLGILLVNLEQILQLKVGCSNFGPVWGRFIEAYQQFPFLMQFYLELCVRNPFEIVNLMCYLYMMSWCFENQTFLASTKLIWDQFSPHQHQYLEFLNIDKKIPK